MIARRPRENEFLEQAALIQWLKYEINSFPELKWLYAIPNGGLRKKATAGKLKAMGVKAGVWDLCLPVPRDKWHGLYVEMKTGSNPLTSAQKDFGAFLQGVGYATAVCHSAKEARDVILTYIQLDGKMRKIQTSVAITTPSQFLSVKL